MKKLKQARKHHGITQGELAKELGVSQSLIAHWERGTFSMPSAWKPKVEKAVVSILRERARKAAAGLKKLEKRS